MNSILELRGVGKDYGDFRVEDVSFQLPVGHVMGLIGPNGAGKTTLIKSIMGLLRPTQGEVLLFGRRMVDDEVGIRSRIGFVYDDARHYPHLSLRKLRGVVAPFYDRWDEPFFQDLVKRFELPLDKALKKFSQGMLTKAALALALSHHAELIVMDEPTSALRDPDWWSRKGQWFLCLMRSRCVPGQCPVPIRYQRDARRRPVPQYWSMRSG